MYDTLYSSTHLQPLLTISITIQSDQNMSQAGSSTPCMMTPFEDFHHPAKKTQWSFETEKISSRLAVGRCCCEKSKVDGRLLPASGGPG